ncbi:hypothetical protein MYAM1_002339 [Malassezia yamatoensis]|uniref:Transcription and mRNA export factor SUS1 n=1 Tax=Malassezia yamatoensis TaxID=253288 RepID=A0AAJ5YZT2_9BASI|nr:hypothetical protein MYAM1_002339 [Malassezia yamatoensis]
MSGGSDSGEQLLNLLHQRLVATGEWNTLLAELRTLLGESEWETQLRDEAEQSIRETMTLKLRDFLDRNLEDA